MTYGGSALTPTVPLHQTALCVHLLTFLRDHVFILAAGEAESRKSEEPIKAQEDLHDLYGGDAMEAAGEAAGEAAAAVGDSSDHAEVGATCLIVTSSQGQAA